MTVRNNLIPAEHGRRSCSRACTDLLVGYDRVSEVAQEVVCVSQVSKGTSLGGSVTQSGHQR